MGEGSVNEQRDFRLQYKQGRGRTPPFDDRRGFVKGNPANNCSRTSGETVSH